MPKFAVILSGCGRADGSEIHEATLALLAIDNNACTYQIFAPDIMQASTINHLTSQEQKEKRNVLEESARIARGNISALSSLNINDFDCILLPGGLGAITNWCNFNSKGLECDVNQNIQKVLEEAYKNKKVIGAMCIAPVLVAKVLGKNKITLTIGNDKNVKEIIQETGAIHEDTEATLACVDSKNLIVTTPAYMLATSIKEVATGADNMVLAMKELVTRS
ncbi:MAG: isoprenoid biosynthesis glyoxalase ElbB [Alphaproteobacteria bacterium]|nr:isoprenoid biosynthesis glyoxalase ElbB [Alphaproteobacteria bacterium]